MKTVEEKAKEYADGMYPNTDNNDYSRTPAEEWDACYDGYMGGYNEAMRWRDPNIELPDYYKKVIVKYERDDSTIDYACVSRLADDEGDYFFGDYHFDIVIDFNRVIGWRPIE